MSFLDIVDIFSNISQLGEKRSSMNRPKIYVLFYILLAVSIFWFALELNSISNLISPFIFIGLFTAVGVSLTICIIILTYKLELFGQLSVKDFFEILIPITFLTICTASFVNRTSGDSKYKSLLTIYDPIQVVDKVIVKLDGENIRIKIPESIVYSLKKGDLMRIEKKTGLIGFDLIIKISKIEK
jgi:hypothetical protein